MSPPATGVVATTACPSRCSTRSAIPRIRAIGPECRAARRGSAGLAVCPRWASSRVLIGCVGGAGSASANRVPRSSGVTTTSATSYSRAARSSGSRRPLPTACATSQPCTAISSAPTRASVSRPEGQVADADRRGGQPLQPGGAHRAGALHQAVDRPGRRRVAATGSRPAPGRARPPRRVRRASPPCGRAASPRSQSAHGVGRRQVAGSRLLEAACVQVTALSSTATEVGGVSGGHLRPE